MRELEEAKDVLNKEIRKRFRENRDYLKGFWVLERQVSDGPLYFSRSTHYVETVVISEAVKFRCKADAEAVQSLIHFSSYEVKGYGHGK